MAKPKLKQLDEIIREQAEMAMQAQKVIQDSIPFEKFLAEQLPWLEEHVFQPMRLDMLTLVKGLDFVHNSIAQVAHIKGQLEALDRIVSRIQGPINSANAARLQLEQLQNSTPQEG